MRFKKAISFVLTALLVTSVFAVPVSASNTSKYYSDVYTSDPFYSAVNYLHEHGIIFGTTENKYSPEKGLSYSTNRYATRYWCLGSGYDYIANPAVFTTLYADTNLDSRISLNELYQYSHDKILASNLNQHVVCCPELDNFIIFESGY